MPQVYAVHDDESRELLYPAEKVSRSELKKKYSSEDDTFYIM